MSPLVRKNAKGHCSEPSFRRVGQPEYPTGENGPLSQLPLTRVSVRVTVRIKVRVRVRVKGRVRVGKRVRVRVSPIALRRLGLG